MTATCAIAARERLSQRTRATARAKCHRPTSCVFPTAVLSPHGQARTRKRRASQNACSPASPVSAWAKARWSRSCQHCGIRPRALHRRDIGFVTRHACSAPRTQVREGRRGLWPQGYALRRHGPHVAVPMLRVLRCRPLRRQVELQTGRGASPVHTTHTRAAVFSIAPAAVPCSRVRDSHHQPTGCCHCAVYCRCISGVAATVRASIKYSSAFLKPHNICQHVGTQEDKTKWVGFGSQFVGFGGNGCCLMCTKHDGDTFYYTTEHESGAKKMEMIGGANPVNPPCFHVSFLPKCSCGRC